MNIKYSFIINPRSGAGKGEKIARLLSQIVARHPLLRDGAAEIFTTDVLSPDRLRVLALQSHLLVGVGGDGTISRLAGTIAGLSPAPVLGIIPVGTSNDLARALGASIKADFTDERVLRETVARLLAGRPARLDLFSINERLLFCNYFSMGFDACIVKDFAKARAAQFFRLLPQGKALNNTLYVLMGFKNIGSRLAAPISISVESPKEECIVIARPVRSLIITNLPFYAGGCRISPNARLDDGLVEIIVVHTLYQYLMIIGTRFLPFLRLPRLRKLQARQAEIQLSEPVACQVDGEECPEIPPPSRLEIRHFGSIQILF